MFIYLGDTVFSMEKLNLRNRKTTLKDRLAIVDLYKTGNWTYSELAKKFEISIPRVCQIVKEYREQ